MPTRTIAPAPSTQSSMGLALLFARASSDRACRGAFTDFSPRRCRRMSADLVMLERVPLVVLAAIVGWCLGLASAWLTSRLEASSDTSEKRSGVALQGFLVRDPIVQGASALVWAAIPIFLAGDWPRWAEAGLLAVPLIQVAVTDFRTRYVYTVVAWIGLAIGLAFGWQVHAGDWWTSVV